MRAASGGAASVTIATDDARIVDSAEGFGADCVMTSPKHASGTDRIAEVVRTKNLAADDIVVNLQGDEPMMPAAVIGEVAEALNARPQVDIATAVAPIQSLAEFLDTSCVKALRGCDGQALYFSRAPVPCRATAPRPVVPPASPVRGGISASTPTGCAACLSSRRGRRARSRRPRGWSSCVRWSMACDSFGDVVAGAACGSRYAGGPGARQGELECKRVKNAGTFRVLFVCLGNICRSPTAEGVFRQLQKQEVPELQIEVDSAGTADYHVGDPPDSRSQRAAMRRGIDLSGLRARQLTAEDSARFDLILAMDRDNLQELKAMLPKGARARLQLFLNTRRIKAAWTCPTLITATPAPFEEVLDLCDAASRGLLASLQKWRSSQYRLPASRMETGSVSTQAINKLRTVAHCRPE